MEFCRLRNLNYNHVSGYNKEVWLSYTATTIHKFDCLANEAPYLYVNPVTINTSSLTGAGCGGIVTCTDSLHSPPPLFKMWLALVRI